MGRPFASSRRKPRRGALFVARLGALWLGLAVMVWTSTLSAQQLFVKRYAADEGLPAAQVFTGFQDARGYFWFGTPGGLARYDGAKFRHFSVEDGLAHDAVRSIVEHEGVLWLTGEKGVTRFDGERGTYRLTAADGLGRGIVWRGLVHAGQLWFGTSGGGLSRYDGEQFTSYTQSDGLGSDNVFALLSDGDTLWIGTRGGGLSRLRDDRLRTFGPDQGLTGRQVMAIAKLGESLWVGTRDAGIFRLDGKRFVPVIPDAKVYSVAARSDELFWGTLGQGVVRMAADGSAQRYDTSHGLTGDRVYSVVIDREDSVWFMTDVGVTKLISDAFLGYLPGYNVLSLARHDGDLWLGTLGKGLWRLTDQGLQVLAEDAGLGETAIWGLASAAGRLWIGTSKGLASYDGLQVAHHATGGPPEQSGIYSILPQGKLLWLTSAAGICAYEIDADQPCRAYTVDQGLPNNVTYGATPYRDSVCFATEGGVACIRDETVTVLGEAEGLSSSSAHAVATDSAGVLWVGTNRGLNRYDGQRFTAYGKAAGLSGNLVAAVREQAPGRLLVASRGLDVFSDGRVVQRFDRKRGLVSNESNFGALFVDESGDVWLGTSGGASRYRPALARTNAIPPPVHIERWAVNGSIMAGAGPFRLEHDRNNVTFDFVGLSFKDEDDVQFRYRLAGYDREWSTPVQTRRIRYTNLPPGAYAFQVEARNGDGIWSTEKARRRFEILPPYWRTWWFGALVLAVILTGAYSLDRLRLGRIRARNLELARTVARRTQQLAQANVELKELSLTDPLTQLRNRRFVREMMGTEVARSQRVLDNDSKGRDSTPGLGTIGFLLIDVDHFKQVNDTHGHEAGDQVLRSIAQQIKQAVRASDVVVRWGGEEFLVVAKDADRDAIRELAERVADAVREARLELPDGETVSRTCSVGFSVYPFSLPNAETFNYEEVVGFADRAMYLAKHNGRDMVVGLVGTDRAVDDDDKAQVKDDIAYGVEEGYVKVVAERSDLTV